MPKSCWTKEESQFLKQHADEWQQLQLDYSSSNKKVGSDDPLNSFISDLVNAFYERFPERDIDQKKGILLLREQRARKYLNNQKRGPAKATVVKARGATKTTTALALFKSEHSEQVTARRDGILQQTPDMNKLDAYNKALQAEWKEFQVTSPEEVQELEAAAKAIRDDTLGNIGDQPPAMQKSEIARTLDQWGKIYNMVSYIVCIWEDTESKTQAFDYASLRARSYLNTKGAKEQRVSFEGWVTKNVGRLLSQQEHGTSLQIFPDINGMPQLPVIQGPCSARIKAQLLRRYFIAKYESQGGLEVTWKRFEKESIDDISRAVEITRMPADITHLVDPARMSVNDMDKWIAHIHKGQKSDAEPHSIFQFHITSAGPYEQPIVHTTLQTVPHPSSRLRYTPAERNFAK
ncbi:hypothetical protein BDV93DRAFT_513178, partial [Ceratobasidium sp. AG-I]